MVVKKKKKLEVKELNIEEINKELESVWGAEPLIQAKKIANILECTKLTKGELKEQLKSIIKKRKEEFKKIEREEREKLYNALEQTEEKTRGEEPTQSFVEFTYNSEGKIVGVKVLVPNVVDYLTEEYDFKTIFGSKTEEIFVYQDGIYTKNGREVIQTQTEKLLGEYCTNHYVIEILEKIKRLSAIPKEDFDKIPEELICLENGILNLKTREFLKHNPKYYFKSKIPVEYNQKADCPKIKKFFEEVLYPEDIKVIQEWLGFSLYRRYFIKKAVILFGDTDTGKTVALNLLARFIGEKNTAGISLQRISAGDKFALSSLKDKCVNIFDDLSSKDLIAGGFKIATGGGYITAEHKFGDPFQFLNFAKHTFATNKIPSIKEIDVDDKAYYNRWMPIPFDNKIEKSKQDNFLIEKLTTKGELGGLLNFVLEGLDRLLKSGKFSFDKSAEEIRRIMERYGNPLSAFCQDVLIRKDGNKISKETMFELYTWYVNENRLARLSKEQLGRRLGKHLTYILSKTGSKERYWENVDINPNIDTLDSFPFTYRGKIGVNKGYTSLIYKNFRVPSKVSKKEGSSEEPPKEIKGQEKDQAELPIETMKIEGGEE